MMIAPTPEKIKSNGHSKKPKVEDIQVRINADDLTYGDIRFMNRIQRVGTDNMSDEDFDKMVDFLDRIIVGGIDKYPLKATPQIMEAISKAIENDRAAHTKNSPRRRRHGLG